MGGGAFKGKSNRSSDIKKQRGSLEGEKKWVEMQKRREALKWLLREKGMYESKE